MSKTEAMSPPKNAELTAQLRWYSKNCGTIPLDVAKATSIHHSALYRFLGETRGLRFEAGPSETRQILLHECEERPHGDRKHEDRNHHLEQGEASAPTHGSLPRS